MSKNILFVDERTIKDRLPMSKAIDFTMVKPFIKLAQDMQIQPVLGSGLYNRLQEGLQENNLNNDEITLLNDYVTDTVLWYTMAMLPIGLGYQLFSKGFLQKTAEESNAPSRSDLELLEERYRKSGEYYGQRMIKYLQENYMLHYTYLNPGTGDDVIFPVANNYSSPIFLGRTYSPGMEGRIYASGGGTNALLPAYFTAGEGVTTFAVPALSGKNVVSASRSGLSKGITTAPTTNPDLLQINGNVITLPIGDAVGIGGEQFIFLYR
jgi:hypothetical protein